MPTDPKTDSTLATAALAVVFALALSLTCFKAREHDLFIHLAAGQWIVEHRQAPQTDMFNFTREHEPWIDALPLFQLLCYETRELAGEKGFTALTMALFLILLSMAHLSRPRDLPLGIAAFFLMAFVVGTSSRNHLRPELLSSIYMAALFLIAERARAGRLWLLVLAPLIQVLFVNTEGLWPIGIAIVGTYLADHTLSAWLAGKRTRRELLPGPWLAALAGCIAAGLVQAYGLRGFMFPLLLLREGFSRAAWHKQIIVEFQPLFSSVLPTPRGYLLFVPLAVLTVAVSAAAGKKIRPFLSLLGALFIFFALDARRNVSIASVVCVQILMVNGREAINAGFLSAWRARLDRGAAVLALTVSMAVMILVQTQDPWRWDESLREPGFGVQWKIFPRRAVDLLKTIDYRGNIINNFDIGGYLIWEGWPDWKVMADGRGEIRGDESLELWARVVLDPEVFYAVADRYQVEAVVVTVSIYDLRVFANRLRRDPEWALVLVDPESAAEVFLRRTPRWEKVIAEREIRR